MFSVIIKAHILISVKYSKFKSQRKQIIRIIKFKLMIYLVMGIVFKNDRFRNRFRFWLGVLDFKTATKLFV